MSDLNQGQASVFACDMNALTREERIQHTAISQQLFAAVDEVQEIEDGYQFRLSQDAATLRRAADFITYERLCCPFFTFHLKVEPNGGPVWVGLSGIAGVKPFIIAELGHHLKDEVTNTAGFR